MTKRKLESGCYEYVAGTLMVRAERSKGKWKIYCLNYVDTKESLNTKWKYLNTVDTLIKLETFLKKK